MLILSRKVGEKIVLPGLNVVLTVCQISRSNVRLGVSAPSAVPVYRQELYERLALESAAPAAPAACPETVVS